MVRQIFSKFELKIYTDEYYSHISSVSTSSFGSLVNDYLLKTVRSLFGLHRNAVPSEEPPKMENQVKKPLSIFPNHIEVYDFKFTLMLLKRYGNVIRRISVENHRMSDDRSDQITIAINKYCSASLNKLNLGFIKQNTMDKLTQPFQMVEDFSFEVSLEKISQKTLPLNETFPNLRRLTVSLYQNLNYKFIDCQMPHLERLKAVATMELGAQPRYDLIERVIRKNPQIRSVELMQFRPGFMKTLNQLLPQLESLTTSGFDVGTEVIHFENVRNAKYLDMLDGSARQITFGKLESLQINYFNHQLDAWCEFFRRHRNLSRLHIYENQQGNYLSDQLEQLTVDLTNLTKISLESATVISEDSVVGLLRSHASLQQIQVTMRYFNDSYKDNLGMKLMDDWEIRDFNDFWAGVRIRRKINSKWIDKRKNFNV